MLPFFFFFFIFLNINTVQTINQLTETEYTREARLPIIVKLNKAYNIYKGILYFYIVARFTLDWELVCKPREAVDDINIFFFVLDVTDHGMTSTNIH